VNQTLGFMSTLDEQLRCSTAWAREACELSLIDARTFCVTVDKASNFARDIMAMPSHRK
jgi:hypothetical protein